MSIPSSAVEAVQNAVRIPGTLISQIDCGNGVILRMIGRGTAAGVLKEVAEAGDSGGFPSSISCFELGQALNRIASNANERFPLAEIVRGWQSADLVGGLRPELTPEEVAELIGSITE